MPFNYSLYSIPVYWVLALYPHAYAVSLIRNSNNKQWDNTNPRSTDTNEQYKKSVPADTYARFERAEAAHKNGLENAPFFIGAVLAGNYAGLRSTTLNAVTGTYVCLRVLYNVLYINTTTQKASRLRSVTWVSSFVLLFGTYIAAGKSLAARV
ncbi:hypothetical protein ACN47E_009089 [Coniothyrium glycines]